MTSPVVAALQKHAIRRAPIRSYPTTFRCTGSDCDWSVQAEDGEEHGRAHVAEAVVEAQREAAMITTVEQLDALPDDSAVLVDDTPARKHLGDWYFANDDGDGYGSRSLALYLPALLVWHPGWVAVGGITP